MKEERALILSMLEQGKITADEAMKLLESLEDTKDYKFNSFEDITSDFKEAVSKIDATEIKDNIKASVSNINTEYLKSDLKNSITSMVQNIFGSGFGDYANSKKTSMNIDLKDISSPNLTFIGVNGPIKIKSYDSDTIKVDITTKFKDASLKDEDLFILSNTNNEISIYPKYENNISVSFDILVPNKLYNTIKLDTKNSSIDCKDLKFIELSALTKNSGIYLSNLDGDNIEAKTSNSRIVLKEIFAKQIVAKTSNSSIRTDEINAESIHLSTSNSRIETRDLNLKTLKEINLETSNSSIISDLGNVNKPIYFSLSTSNGSITVDNPSSLVYSNLKSKSRVSAHTTDFDEAKEYIKFTASTSNGSIKII